MASEKQEAFIKKFLLDNWAGETKDIAKEIEWYSKNGADPLFARVCYSRLMRRPKKKKQRFHVSSW